ncbi:hypothetical protein MRX96_012169 [Rhipicephalus microplus]
MQKRYAAEICKYLNWRTFDISRANGPTRARQPTWPTVDQKTLAGTLRVRVIFLLSFLPLVLETAAVRRCGRLLVSFSPSFILLFFFKEDRDQREEGQPNRSFASRRIRITPSSVAWLSHVRPSNNSGRALCARARRVRLLGGLPKRPVISRRNIRGCVIGREAPEWLAQIEQKAVRPVL